MAITTLLWLAPFCGAASSACPGECSDCSASSNPEPAEESNIITIGALLPLSGGWPGGRTVAGALALAVDDVNNNPEMLHGKRLEYVYADDGCEASVSLTAASEMLSPQKRGIVALIGPACSTACETTGFLTKGLNTAQISYSCSSPALSNKGTYPTFVRTTSPYGGWMPSIVGLMQWAGWTKLSSIATTANLHSLAADLLRTEVQSASMSLEVDIRFRSGRFDPAELRRIIAARLRVVFVLGYEPDVLAVALAGHDQGMTTAGWAWLGLDNVPGSETGAAAGQIDVAKASLDGWLYIEPATAAPQAFFEMVKNRSSQFNVIYNENEETNGFATSLYDAVILFARAATAIMDAGGSVRDGRAVVAAMKNVSFNGMNGLIQLDSYGDLRESISVKNYVLLPNRGMKGVAVGLYDSGTKQFISADSTPHIRPTSGLSRIRWPGQTEAMPVDSVKPPLECPAGSFVDGASCKECAAGSSSAGGNISACDLCIPGTGFFHGE